MLADSGGLERVTIRRLAKDVGVTPMALYWHFRNKDELLDAMMGRIFAGVDSALSDSATWVEQFRALMRSLAEVALDVLRRGGFSPTEATQVSRHALSTIVNLVVGEPGFIAPEDSGELLDARRRARLYLEALPPDRYPRLVEAAVPLSAPEDPEAYDEFGLDLLLAGVEEMADRKQHGTTEREHR